MDVFSTLEDAFLLLRDTSRAWRRATALYLFQRGIETRIDGGKPPSIVVFGMIGTPRRPEYEGCEVYTEVVIRCPDWLVDRFVLQTCCGTAPPFFLFKA